ncbi:hypothetical protein BegalDRAFT_1871 [Beggiatoa alba B18LD]|uniref:Uncharacterized protein n=1 Tax=Beggiatoa alba B18LD TaxID=395493 RepID=I3CGK2_9GAMM|nr:hypothetical protein [Beggiatoa alba]EIJ42745.1 hypothetical protein BegalDRAFT_1871 [Beggiatoa alba B18LD]
MTLFFFPCLFISGLFIDQYVPDYGQLGVNLIVWAIFLRILWQHSPVLRVKLILCLVYATLGELFLSLVWGLYIYRLDNVPLFVPAGHVLLFITGLLVARRLPNWIIWVVPSLTLPLVIFNVFHQIDTLSSLLSLIFMLCILFGRWKKLYASMFVMALSLEIVGTGLGNWYWLPEVAWLGINSHNPPLGAGAFYCLLDLLVVLTMQFIKRYPFLFRPFSRAIPATEQAS